MPGEDHRTVGQGDHADDEPLVKGPPDPFADGCGISARYFDLAVYGEIAILAEGHEQFLQNRRGVYVCPVLDAEAGGARLVEHGEFRPPVALDLAHNGAVIVRSEEHTSELQS